MNGADGQNGGTEVRGFLPSRMLSEFGTCSKDRFDTARFAAFECEGLPPRVAEKLKKAKQHPFYSTYTSFRKHKCFNKNVRKTGVVKFQVTPPPLRQSSHSGSWTLSLMLTPLEDLEPNHSPPLKAHLCSSLRLSLHSQTRDGEKNWTLTLAPLEEVTCGCGYYEVNKFPCTCLIFSAEKAGIPVESLLQKEDTGEWWKEQYRGVPEFEVPGTAQIFEVTESDSVLLAPTAVPAKKVGRPRTKPGLNSSDHAAAAAAKKGNGKGKRKVK
jgi:hypothetical protein